VASQEAMGDDGGRPSQDFVALAGQWCRNRSAILLKYVWKAYDELKSIPPAAIDPEDVERSLTQLLEPRIRKAMTGYETFYIQHGPYERETKMPPPAQPPQYDIAFVLLGDERLMWPLEAKKLETDGTVADYVDEVRDQFLTCRYAPFSSEGAMLGYLLLGDHNKAFRNIAAKLPCVLVHHAGFPHRAHRVSHHVRRVPRGKLYPRDFTCHHLIMLFPALAAQRQLPLSCGRLPLL